MPRKKSAAPSAPAGASEAPQPAPIDDAEAKLEAEQAFRRAQDCLKAGKLNEAVRVMARVVELQPNEPDYQMFKAWASYLRARVEVRAARAKAVVCAQRATEADSKAARPHAILGRLALDDGDHLLASKEFQAALLRDPHDEEALTGMKRTRAKN